MAISKELTVVIPLRIDSEERKENLDAIVKFFTEQTEASIIILEADKSRKYEYASNERLSYIFVEDDNEIFFRTHYLNQLIALSPTPIVGVWDTDVLMPVLQIYEAILRIKQGATMCFPYDSGFIPVSKEESISIRSDLSVIYQIDSYKGIYSLGGAFIINKEKYLWAGGENEFFYGWGPEDVERVKRMEILGLEVCRVQGLLYHLYHPVGKNSTCDTKERDIYNLQTLLNICKMDKTELLSHISKWSWRK